MSPGCLFSSPAGSTDGAQCVESCRICNSTWQPEKRGGRRWARALLHSARVGARPAPLHGQGGREDNGEDSGARSEQEDHLISFHSKGVSSTRSGPGRRELKPPGFVSVNCLEAGWFPRLARRARAGAGLGDARSGAGRGTPKAAFPGASAASGPAAAGGSPGKARDVPSCWRKPREGSGCSRLLLEEAPRRLGMVRPSSLVQVRASHRGLARP